MPLELHTSETFLKEVLGTVKYFLKKHMHMTKTHKAWVLSIIGYPIQVLQIQNSAFSWTNTPHPKQWCYSIQTLSQWHLILYSRTKFPRSWIYTNKKIQEMGIYILCWQICGHKYKTTRDCMTVLVMDSKMSVVPWENNS